VMRMECLERTARHQEDTVSLDVLEGTLGSWIR